MNAQLVFYFLFCYVSTEFLPKRNCSNKEFECNNGQCILKGFWCPARHYYSNFDCKDGSNIEHCSQNLYSCYRNYTHCLDNGKCIPLKWICDGYNDCADGSDEIECLSGFRIRDIPGIGEARSQARNWIMQQRKIDWGWDEDSARAIVALSLSNRDGLETDEHERELELKQLKIQLSEDLLRHDNFTFPTHKLAHYIHSLLATCQDPRRILGQNIIEKLNELFGLSKYLNPFVTLVLCNSNSALSSFSIIELMKIMLKSSKPESIDSQAYAAMTLSCLRKRNLNFLQSVHETFLGNQTEDAEYKNITTGKNLFKNLQKEDGSFGTVYTTALVMQALLSTSNNGTQNWDVYKAYKYILQQQKLDGSFGDMMYTYLILPLLHFRTLVDLSYVNCSLEQPKLRNLTAKKEFELQRTEKQRVAYSIWLKENRDISFQMSMNMPINTTFYDVMRLAAEMDSKYSFQLTQYQRGKYVYSIFNISNDPEARTYWKLYRDNGSALVFVGEYPDKVIPNDGDKFIYWYKQHKVLS